MKTKVLLGVVALLACSAASADELGARLAGGASRAPAAMLYVAFPLAARHHDGPTFGLRMEQLPATDFASARAGNKPLTARFDVPFNKKRSETDTQALNVLAHPGIVIGAAVGVVLVLSASNSDDSGGGGY